MCGVSPTPGLSGRRRDPYFIAATNPNGRAHNANGVIRRMHRTGYRRNEKRASSEAPFLFRRYTAQDAARLTEPVPAGSFGARLKA